MDLRRLEAFKAVYEHGSFSKAGQAMFLSQPTVSAHVLTLEEELGVRLFDRLGRKVVPTSAAETLYSLSKEIFVLLEKAKAEMEVLRHEVAGILNIGASTIPAHCLLPKCLAAFLEEFPRVELKLHVLDTAGVTAMVADGGLMLGIVGAPPSAAEIEAIELVRDELLVVAKPGLFKAENEPMDAKEAASLPWIIRERGSGTRAAMEKGLNKAGLDISALKTVAMVDTTQATLEFARHGVGVGVTSRLAAQEKIDRNELAVLNIANLDMKRSFHLIRNTSRHFFPAARAFVFRLFAALNPDKVFPGTG